MVALPEAWMSWGGIVPTDYDPVKNVVGAGPLSLKVLHPASVHVLYVLKITGKKINLMPM